MQDTRCKILDAAIAILWAIVALTVLVTPNAQANLLGNANFDATFGTGMDSNWVVSGPGMSQIWWAQEVGPCGACSTYGTRGATWVDNAYGGIWQDINLDHEAHYYFRVRNKVERVTNIIMRIDLQYWDENRVASPADEDSPLMLMSYTNIADYPQATSIEFSWTNQTGEARYHPPDAVYLRSYVRFSNEFADARGGQRATRWDNAILYDRNAYYRDNEIVEEFSYDPHISMTNLLGGKGRGGNFTNLWTEFTNSFSTTGAFTIVDTHFSQVTNYRTQRGHTLFTRPAAKQTNEAFRYFVPITNGVLYAGLMMSYQVSEDASGGQKKSVGFSFMSNTTQLAFFGEIASVASNHGIGAFGGGGDVRSSFKLDPGEDYIVFAKYDFSTRQIYSHAYGTGDTIPTTEPAWAVTGSVPAGRINSINGVRLVTGASIGTPGDTYFDELYLAPYWIPGGPAGKPDATNLVAGTITDRDMLDGNWTIALYLTNGLGGVESTNAYLGFFPPYYSLNNSEGDMIITNDNFEAYAYVDAATLVASNTIAPTVDVSGVSIGDYRLTFNAISSNYVKQLEKDTYSDGLAITFNVTDDDTTPPVATSIEVNSAEQMTDADIRSGFWPLEIVFQDESGIYMGSGAGGSPTFHANYNLVNPNDITVRQEVVWDEVTSSSDYMIHTALDQSALSVPDPTNVLLGTWRVIWSAQDNDDDRVGERAWVTFSETIQGDSNTFWVVDDDTTPPGVPSNIVVVQDAWTNVNYFEATWDRAYDAQSAIGEYRLSTNAAKPVTETDGVVLDGFNSTNTLALDLINGDIETGTAGSTLPLALPFSNSWVNFGNTGTKCAWTGDVVHAGGMSMYHECNSGGSQWRESRMTQDIYIDNTNNHRVQVTLSGWFIGDMSQEALGRKPLAYLGIEFLDAASNRIAGANVSNQDSDSPDHNGAPLWGVNVATWTNVSVTTAPDNHGPALAQYVRCMAGLFQNGTDLPIEGRWDDLTVSINLITVGGTDGMTFTNVPEGTHTNWIFAVDNDIDRDDDGLMGPVTTVVTRLDQTAPALVNITNAIPGPDPTSEIMIGWDPLADGGGADLSPWWSYVVYYTDQARDATNTDPFVDAASGPSEMGTISTRQVIISNLNDETVYRVTVAGRDRAGNESPVGSSSFLVSLASFSMTQGVLFVDAGGQPKGSELSWRAATDIGGSVIKTYDLIYADAMSFSDSLTNSWSLLQTVTDSFVLDTGTSTRTPPTDLIETMRFYRVAQEGLWALTNNPPLVSKDVYVMKNLTLSNGHNFVSLFLVPDTNCVAFVLGTNLLPAGGVSATSTVVSWYDAAGSAVVTNEIWLADDGHWMWSAGLGGAGVADYKSLPLTQGFNIEIPTGGPFRVLVLGHIPTNSFGQTIEPNQTYNVVGYPEPRTIKVRELGIEADGFSGGPTRRSSDEVRILAKGTGPLGSPRLRLWFDTDDSTWKNYVTGADAMDESIAPDEAIVIYSRESSAPYVWTMDLHYTAPGKNMNP